MTAQARFVNRDNVSSGDGTTNETDSSADSAYISGASWEANEAVDLVAAGDTHTVNFDGSGADTGGQIALNTWTTGASNRLTLQGNVSNLHEGKWDAGKYHIQVSDTFDGAIEINNGAEYCTVQHLQLEQQGAVTSQSRGLHVLVSNNVNTDIIVRRCLVFQSATGTPTVDTDGLRLENDVNCVFSNNCIFGNFFDGIRTFFTAIGAIKYVVYANTVVDSSNVGIRISQNNAPTEAHVRNNISSNSGSTDYEFSGTEPKFTSGNCSSDTSSLETHLRSRTFTFVDAGNDDYHLADNDVGARGTGVDLSADAVFAFNDDVDGDTRTAWDSGFDERTNYTALSQITLDADGTINTAEIEHDAGTGSPYFTHANDANDGLSSDYVFNALDSDGTFVAWFSLADIDADLDIMASLILGIDTIATGFTNDTCTLTARIFDADNDVTNPLTDETAAIIDESNTTRSQQLIEFNTLAGTKAQWDAAHIRFTWIYDRITSPDGGELRIHGCELDGFYVAAVASDLIVPPLLHSQAVNRAANY